jgi:hypothetical protein
MSVDLQTASSDMCISHIYSKLDIEENRPEAKFLDVFGKKKSKEFSSLLFTVTFSNGFYPPGVKGG